VLCSADPMFHAVIRSAESDPLCLSGEASPYNLQVLRDHLLARRGRQTRVEVRLAPSLEPVLRRALRGLERHGVTVVVRA